LPYAFDFRTGKVKDLEELKEELKGAYTEPFRPSWPSPGVREAMAAEISRRQSLPQVTQPATPEVSAAPTLPVPGYVKRAGTPQTSGTAGRPLSTLPLYPGAGRTGLSTTASTPLYPGAGSEQKPSVLGRLGSPFNLARQTIPASPSIEAQGIPRPSINLGEVRKAAQETVKPSVGNVAGTVLETIQRLRNLKIPGMPTLSKQDLNTIGALAVLIQTGQNPAVGPTGPGGITLTKSPEGKWYSPSSWEVERLTAPERHAKTLGGAQEAGRMIASYPQIAALGSVVAPAAAKVVPHLTRPLQKILGPVGELVIRRLATGALSSGGTLGAHGAIEATLEGKNKEEILQTAKAYALWGMLIGTAVQAIPLGASLLKKIPVERTVSAVTPEGKTIGPAIDAKGMPIVERGFVRGTPGLLEELGFQRLAQGLWAYRDPHFGTLVGYYDPRIMSASGAQQVTQGMLGSGLPNVAPTSAAPAPTGPARTGATAPPASLLTLKGASAVVKPAEVTGPGQPPVGTIQPSRGDVIPLPAASGITVSEGQAGQVVDEATLRQQAVAVQEVAKQKQADLNQMMDDVVKEHGLKGYEGTVKTVDSMVAKVLRKQPSDYGVHSMKDHARGVIYLNDFSEVPKVVESLARRGQFRAEVHIDEPLNQFGYRGINLSVTLGDGINGEIQIHTPESWQLKLETDEIYRKWRDIEPKKIQEGPPEIRALYERDLERSYALWDEFWNRVTPEVRRAASSAVMGLESVTWPNVPSNSSQAPPFQTTGTLPSRMGEMSMTLPSDRTPYPENGISTSPPSSSVPQTTPGVQSSQASQPAKPGAEKPQASAREPSSPAALTPQKGDFVSNGLTTGIIIGEGTIGKNPAWKIETAGGKVSAMLKGDDVRVINRAGFPARDYAAMQERGKATGFRSHEEAVMALEAKSMPYSEWLKSFDEIDPKVLKEHFPKMKPKQIYDALVKKAEAVPEEFREKLRIDLQLFARSKLKPEEMKQVRKWIEETRKILKGKLRPEYRAEIDALLKEADWRVTYRTKKKVARLEKTRAFLENNPDAYMPPHVLKELEILSKKPLGQMTFGEIEQMFSAVKRFAHLSQVKDKFIVGKRLRDFAKVVEEIKGNIETARPGLPEAKNLIQSASDPKPGIVRRFHDAHLMIETLTFAIEGKEGGPLQRILYNDFHKGVREQTRLYNLAEDTLRKVTDKHDIIPWSTHFNPKASGVQWIEAPFKPGGRRLLLSPAEVMSLYLHSLNADNKAALLEGGFKLKRLKAAGVVKITEKQLKDIIGKLTPAQREVADAMGKYLDGAQKEAMNETSTSLIGDHIARVKHYWRITHPWEELDRETQGLIKKFLGVRAIEEMGFLKPREGSRAAIYLDDAFAQFVESVSDGALYAGLAVPVRNARMLLADKAFVGTMEQAGLGHELGELKRYVDYMEGTLYSTSPVESMVEHALRNVYASILGLNFSVTVKQPISYIVAMTEIDPKYMLKALATKPKPDLIRKYSPIGRLRLRGHVHPEMGEVSELGEVLRFFTGRIALPAKFTKPILWADTQTVARLWNAVEFETRDRYPGLEGDAFYEKVAERWEDVLNKTQVGGPPHTRSPVARSRDLWVRVVTMFSSQRNKNYNTGLRACLRYTHSQKTAADKVRLAKDLFLAYLGQAMLVTAATALAQRVYKGSRRDRYLDPIKIVSAMLSNVYGAGVVFDTIVARIQKGSYSVDMGDPLSDTVNEGIKVVEDAFRAIEEGFSRETYATGAKKGEEKWKTTSMRALSNLFTFGGKVTGIPTTNIRRGLEAAAKHAFPEAEFAIDSMTKNPQSTYYYDLFWEAKDEKARERYARILRKEFGVSLDGLMRSGKGRGVSKEDLAKARETFIKVATEMSRE